MRVLIALACILPLATAAIFEWRGGNTNWNEKANWRGTAPTDGCPASIDLTGNSFPNKPTITSRLDGTVVAGGSIKFPTNGRIILSDASKIKFNPDCTDSAAVFTGGFANVKSNSLNCRSNYFVNNKPALRTPCEGDSIIVPADKTIRVWSTERVNIDSIRFGSTNFDTCQGIAADAAVSSQLGGVTCGRSGNFLIKDSQPCIDAKQTNIEGDCICFENPECLSEEDIRNQALLERLAAEELARLAAEALAVNVTKTFTGSFTAAALGVDPSDLLFIKNDPTILENFLLDLRQKLADSWGVPIDQVAITQFDIANGGISVAITGTVTAPKSAFLEPGQDPATVTSDTINLSGSQLTQLQQIIRSTVSQAILDNALKIYQQQIADLLAQCGADPLCPVANDAITLLQKVFVDPAKVYDAISSCADLPCVTNELNNNAELVKKSSATADDLQALIDTLAKLIPITAGSNVDVFLDGASDVATNANQADARKATLPQDTTFLSPTIEVGQNRPRVDLAHVISSVNAPNLRFALRFALSPFLIIKKIDPASIKLDLKFDTASRRRGVTNDDLPTAILLSFNYVTSCNPADTRNCGFKVNDAVYKDVQKRINNIVDAFEIVSHSKCYDFQTGYDNACLQGEANLAYNNAMKANKTAAAALDIAKTAIVTIAECGDYGKKPSGGCVFRDTTVDALAATMAAKAQASYVPPNNGGGGNGGSGASTGGSSGGGLPLPVIAGAAGGGVLIIIIVIVVVMRRKKGDTTSKQADNRTVVAFENPMYDDPSQQNNPNYEATAEHGEGLYDEPAYNAQSSLAKSNPMYESTENIAAAGGEEGGYLDVAPEDQ